MDIRMKGENGKVKMKIEDNGNGFDVRGMKDKI